MNSPSQVAAAVRRLTSLRENVRASLRRLLPLVAALALLCFTSPLSAAAPNTKPNSNFIRVDDLGYADLGFYGAQEIRTPHIDRRAREGVKFTDFCAKAPVCTPTRKQKAVRHGKWKYVQDGVVVDLLFDLENDISERRDLSFHHPEILADLKARLKTWEDEMAREKTKFLVK